jgi:hypothetical protein
MLKAVVVSFATATILGCSLESSPKTQLCDENTNRYAGKEEARAAGLSDAEFGATYCPEYKMHPSWDTNNDGINDCVPERNCDANNDYMSRRP